MNSIPSVPNGAIENGRVFLQRLAEHYDFSCEAGSLANCTDYQEAVRCFEFIAEWFSGFPYALPHLSAPCVVSKPVDVEAVRRQAFEEGFENGIEQSLDALNAYDDITRKEAEQAIHKLNPDYRALSHELVS